jgi:tRNA1Val (adenine37-N6)-methyltransferase
MSNSYFSFKQFTVHQDRCAMKVSTDACIQGAWTPLRPEIRRVLDVGAGTGLLSMMIAQRLPGVHVDAIELNEAAAAQAKENVASSPFADRIHIIKGDAASWNAGERYDLIVCNPPFFKSALLGPDKHRNAARHIDSLDAATLAKIILDHLATNGTASFLWPVKEFEAFKIAAGEVGLYLAQRLNIRHRATSPVTRVIGIWQKLAPASYISEELMIRASNEAYSQEFADLLRPFYLSL